MSVIFGIFNKNGKNVFENELISIQNSFKRQSLINQKIIIQNEVGLGYSKLEASENPSQKTLPIRRDNLLITADLKLTNRDELSKLLVIGSEDSDAELVLLLYEKYGNQCVNYLKGEFVLAIWNDLLGELFISTDPMGNRSVYYYETKDVFIFSSEIKGIEAIKKTDNYFNERSIVEYYFRKSNVTETYNEEIKFLTSANFLLVRKENTYQYQYWTLKPSNKYNFKTNQEWIDHFKKLFYETIEKHIDLEVPIGISLSGGLDSSSITCVLAEFLQQHNKPLYTFSSVLSIDHKGIEKDERKYIECLVKKYPNIITTYIETNDLNPFEEIEDAFEENESFPDSFFYMDRKILKAASKKGVQSLFYGFGGDYWVSYNGGKVAYELLKNKKFRKSWKLIQEHKHLEKSSYFKVIKQKYITYNSFYKWTKEKLKRSKNWQIYTPLHSQLLNKYEKEISSKIHFSNHSEFMIERIKSGRIGKTLFQLNNNSQNFGIHSVFPMLDVELMSFLLELPISIFVHGGVKRGLIKSSLKGVLPEEIVYRNDKLPYIPGYQMNIIKEKEVFDNAMNTTQIPLFFEKYFDKKIIEQHFKDIVLEEGFTRGRDIVGIRMSQVMIVYYSLLLLVKKDYYFNKS